MNSTRRNAIALIGGGVVLAAAAGARVMRKPTNAARPWTSAGSADDPRMAALSWAVLAPSAHNLQPWLARLDADGGITLFENEEKRLPAVDPKARQQFIGMGCFIELLDMALAEQGKTTKIALFPDAADRPVARIRIAEGGEPDPLFRHVARRRTNRSAFEDRLVPPDALNALAASAPGARVTANPETVARLRDLTLAAMLTEAQTPGPARETISNMRIGAREIDATPEGIALRGPLVEALTAARILTREKLSSLSGLAHSATLDTYRKAFPATPAYGWVLTIGNERTDQIAAGRAWMRMQLQATSFGLAMQPVSQCLEEYPEVSGYKNEVHRLLGAGGWRIQMIARLGFGPVTPPAPRWPVSEKIVEA